MLSDWIICHESLLLITAILFLSVLYNLPVDDTGNVTRRTPSGMPAYKSCHYEMKGRWYNNSPDIRTPFQWENAHFDEKKPLSCTTRCGIMQYYPLYVKGKKRISVALFFLTLTAICSILKTYLYLSVVFSNSFAGIDLHDDSTQAFDIRI